MLCCVILAVVVDLVVVMLLLVTAWVLRGQLLLVKRFLLGVGRKGEGLNQAVDFPVGNT